MSDPRSEFIQGMRDTVPMVVGAIPFGILFGTLAITSGLSVGATLAFSLLVFAGSAQFIAATLVAAGTPVGVIVITTFVVNLRHALYAASLGPYMQGLPLRWLFPLAYWLTDESYAVVIQRYERSDRSPFKHWYFFGSGFLMYTNWQLCTVIGVYTGQRLSGLSDWGLEFAMVVTFIGIVVPMLRNWPMILSAVVAGLTAVLAHDLPNQSGLLLAAATGISAGFWAETITSGPAK